MSFSNAFVVAVASFLALANFAVAKPDPKPEPANGAIS